MVKTIVNVEGMSCGHCVKSVTEALTKLAGVENVDVSLEAKTVTVTHNDLVDTHTIKSEIEEVGFEVV